MRKTQTSSGRLRASGCDPDEACAPDGGEAPVDGACVRGDAGEVDWRYGAPETVGRCEASMALAERNAAAMRACFENYREGRLEEALAFVDEDALIVSHFPKTLDFPFAGEWRGRSGAGNWLQCLTDCFEILTYETASVCALGDHVTAMHRVTSRHHATGARCTGVLCHVIRMHEGRIVELHEHFNARPIQAAIVTARVLAKRTAI